MKLKKFKSILRRVEEGTTTEKDARKLRKLFKKMRRQKPAKKGDVYLHLEMYSGL